MTKPLRAWLLDWPPQILALSLCEVVEIVEQPEIHGVPAGPPWCRSLLYWRERLLPLAQSPAASGRSWIVVVAYQVQPRLPMQHAGIAVSSLPRQFEVPRGTDVALPEPSFFTLAQVRACFEVDGRSVIVPELYRWFEP